jgi:CheY-like chemotaxis protein
MEFQMCLEISKTTPPFRVLVVDDTADVRVVLAKILRRIGLEVETADDGQQGHDIALEARDAGHPFDLVLMDMQMPVMDGFSATILLRKHQYGGRIVAVTGMGDARNQCLLAGCDDFIAKPIALEILQRLILSQIVSNKHLRAISA